MALIFQISWNAPLCPELRVNFFFIVLNLLCTYRVWMRYPSVYIGSTQRCRKFNDTNLSMFFMSWTKNITISTNATQAEGFDQLLLPLKYG